MVHKIVKSQKKIFFMSNKFFLFGILLMSSLYFFYKNQNIARMALFNENTRIGSREVGLIAQMKVPIFMRSLLFGFYSMYYGVIVDDMVHPFNHYETVNQFFTREVQTRQISPDPSALTAPADSKILSIEKIQEDQVIAVKGVNYSLGQFLYGKDIKFSKNQINQLKKNPSNDLYSVVFYLAPGDYHRYHSHDQMKINQITHIPGYLFNVKDTKLTPTTYTENERVIVKGNSDFGNFYYGIVGATNVGSIELSFDLEVLTNSELDDSKVNN
jgi:phosphatidylserine decarboxylase